MSIGTIPKISYGGEDWWRDFDNSQIAAKLGNVSLGPMVEVHNRDDAMGLFLQANRQSMRMVIEAQPDTTAGQLALQATAHTLRAGINN